MTNSYNNHERLSCFLRELSGSSSIAVPLISSGQRVSKHPREQRKSQLGGEEAWSKYALELRVSMVRLCFDDSSLEFSQNVRGPHRVQEVEYEVIIRS